MKVKNRINLFLLSKRTPKKLNGTYQAPSLLKAQPNYDTKDFQPV